MPPSGCARASRSGASIALTGLAMVACGLASARWARSEVGAFDAAENAAVAAAPVPAPQPATLPPSGPATASTPTASGPAALPAMVTLAPNDRAIPRDRPAHKPRR